MGRVTLALPKRVLHYGADVPPPESIKLQAGPLSLIWASGGIRYVRLGDRELLRGIYVAVRDRDWRTVPAVLSNLQKEIDGRAFRIAYDAVNRGGGIDYAWRATITGEPDGTLTFAMDGVARSTFTKNRIGLCVLYPIRECAGSPCLIERVDGSQVRGEFPRAISPHQPFLDIHAVCREVIPGVWNDVRFAGDTFEMEDQRNWTDASFKVYSTPLSLPSPVEVHVGTRISQSVTVTLRGKAPDRREDPGGKPLTFTIARSPLGPIPRLGLGAASHGRPLTRRELDRLKALNLSHLRMDLRLSQPDHVQVLDRVAAEADALGVSLEAALLVSNAAREELRGLLTHLKRARPRVSAWLIFHVAEKSTSEQWVVLAREVLSKYDPTAKVGAGTNAHFCEVNRRRPPASVLDFLCYSINPQVHASDNATLIEALEAGGWTVQNARDVVANMPVAVSPVTLKPRFRSHTAGAEAEPASNELPYQVDVRQMSLFGAGWTVGSLKYLAENGAASVTYYETSGWRGVMETEQGSPLPEVFRSLPGSVFPMYHVLADIGEFQGGWVVPTRSSVAPVVDGLALYRDGRVRVLLANLSADAQQVVVEGLPTEVRIRHLDERNAVEAMSAPEAFRRTEGERCRPPSGTLSVGLLPHAIVRIDGAAAAF